MSNLTLSQASHVKVLRSLRLLNLPCKKIVCCYSKEIRNLHEQLLILCFLTPSLAAS